MQTYERAVCMYRKRWLTPSGGCRDVKASAQTARIGRHPYARFRTRSAGCYPDRNWPVLALAAAGRGRTGEASARRPLHELGERANHTG